MIMSENLHLCEVYCSYAVYLSLSVYLFVYIHIPTYVSHLIGSLGKYCNLILGSESI